TLSGRSGTMPGRGAWGMYAVQPAAGGAAHPTGGVGGGYAGGGWSTDQPGGGTGAPGAAQSPLPLPVMRSPSAFVRGPRRHRVRGAHRTPQQMSPWSGGKRTSARG